MEARAKLRQLQRLQDRRRQSWRRQQPTRVEAATAAVAGVYTEPSKLLMGGVAVGLMAVLLTTASLHVLRLMAPRSPTPPPPQFPPPPPPPPPPPQPTAGPTAGVRDMNRIKPPSHRGPENVLQQQRWHQEQLRSQPSARKASRAPEVPDSGQHAAFLKFLQLRSDYRTRSRKSFSPAVRASRALEPWQSRSYPMTSGDETPWLFNNESELIRRRRSVEFKILFVNNWGYYDNEIGKKYYDWMCVASDECFYYRGGEAEYVSPESQLQICTFSRGYEYDVPAMISDHFALKRSESYRFYLTAKIPGILECMVQQFGMGCQPYWHTESTGFPPNYNNAVTEVMLGLLEVDYRNLHLSHPERGQLIRFLLRECRMHDNALSFYRWNLPYYKNPAAIAYTTVLAYYGRCMLGYTLYCPDPCKSPTSCGGLNMLSLCYPIELDTNQNNKYQRRIDAQFTPLKKIFSRVAYCQCVPGFYYDIETESCVVIPFECSMSNECLNNGLCESVPEHVRQVIGREFNCNCPPAWQGLRCEEARDPCLDPNNRDSCGNFQCRRSPSDGIFGFMCICSTGYTMTRQRGKPSCRDINECAVSTPCLNAGECRNLEGSFQCICSRNFTGFRCEIPPPEPFWMPWGAWTACSVSCSIGMQHRWRSCSQEGSCVGLQKDFKTCMGRQMECTFASLNDISPEQLAGGAGWRPEEDKILDDAWFFREFQLLRLGLNARYMPEDELTSGWEDLLYLYIHFVALVGFIQAFALLLLCYRIRVRI